MLEEFKKHNLFRENLTDFHKEDPHLSYLNSLKYVASFDWWKDISWEHPGIYILTGGRQIGKSTSTKLLIAHVLKKKIFPSENILYLPADQVIDHIHLTRLIRLFLDTLPERSPFLLVIDEVTFVQEWDRSIKALADEGWFRRGFCLLTGSDTVILKEATSRFPGRRGKADQVDFHLRPLSFKAYVDLVTPPSHRNRPSDLSDHFSKYLQCGGYLRAINDLHSEAQISLSTYMTFEQWVRGDFIKRKKSEENLLLVLQALCEVGISQSSYGNLSEHAAHLTKDTVIEYIQMLERMDIIYVLEAFDMNTRRGFPKKAKKFHFSDPFIGQTLMKWLMRERRISKPMEEAFRVESCVVSQYYAKLPCYYMKAEGEIDLIVALGKKFLPIEVKWSQQLRPKDLKQLKKYPSSIILSQNEQEGTIENVQAYPLPVFLLDYTSQESLETLVK